MTVATAIYRSIMVEVERRRLQLGWPMWKLDDAAGTDDGHYGHCLYPDTPSGRQCQWATLELFVEAMFPDGYEVEIRQKKTGRMDAANQRSKIRSAAAYTDTRTLRERMRDLGKRPTKEARSRGRKRNIPKWRRREIARQGGLAKHKKRIPD